MKKILKIASIIIITLILIVLYLFFPRNYEQIDSNKPEDNSYFRLMTYNIKNSYQDYDGWLERRSEVIKLIKDYSPDVIGIQEADIEWLNYLKEELNEYEFYAVGRDYDGTYNEYNPILYNKERFELVNQNTLWLSETPDEMSLGWDGACKRIVSYVTLKDRETSEIFTYYNTHLDHEGKETGVNGYNVISNQISKNEIPSILSGDFNATPFSEVYKLANSELDDSKKIAAKSMNFGTINYFSKLYAKFFPRIDYIFVTREKFVIERYAVIPDYKYGDMPISDHHPVFIDLKLSEK